MQVEIHVAGHYESSWQKKRRYCESQTCLLISRFETQQQQQQQQKLHIAKELKKKKRTWNVEWLKGFKQSFMDA